MSPFCLFQSPTPAPYIKEMNDAGQFYTNRVLKDWKEKNKSHVDWVKSWIQTLTELQAFVKRFHTTGLVWGGKGAPAAAPPPPSAPLPPPPIADFGAAPLDPGIDRSALFAQLNQGANITSRKCQSDWTIFGKWKTIKKRQAMVAITRHSLTCNKFYPAFFVDLKKVTPDMQTHKNPTLKQEGPVSFKGHPDFPSGPASGIQVDKPPKFTRDGKKWLIVSMT